MKKYNYEAINYEVMTDTKRQYESLNQLKAAINHSISNQYMVAQEDDISQPMAEISNTRYIVSGKRSFEAAKTYAREKKVAVLNFANSHSIGGAPYTAGAQEESLCRCSTLLPCLEAMNKAFYERHRQLYDARIIDFRGNDDLIYTPDVVVFKTDERTEPVYPKMMPENEWYRVNVITSAAPEIKNHHLPNNYEAIITSRIKKILDVAAKEKNEVLILGAWGCGDFRNPADVVARVFFSLLKNYNFDIVEFACYKQNVGDSAFAKLCPTASITLKDEEIGNTREEIIRLLQSTHRENIEQVIDFLDKNDYFNAPASVNYHNNFQGGLAKHSLEVYREAVELNKDMGMPATSIILCSLLHDICKCDQYIISNGKVTHVDENMMKGHGRRSMYMLIRECQLPLNYNEAMAIWWHMGEYERSKKWCADEYEKSKTIPLCSLIQEADKRAALKAL